MLLIEFAVATCNGKPVPENVASQLRDLGERLFITREAESRLTGQIEPVRPDYLDQETPTEEVP